jgi:hypothetical protein
MKKLFVLLLLSFFIVGLSPAQDKLYLIFDFMKVDNEQEAAYAETEEFWEKIHQQRANNGDIIGWDLWSLQPGGEDQGFQYLTVTLFSDPVKMMSGAGTSPFIETAKAAYPNMSEADITKKLRNSGSTRDRAVVLYLEQIDATTGEFDMPLGTVASIDLMKASFENYGNYEKAESETFKPLHQNQVDEGRKGSWGLTRVISPIGSDTYTSHITVNMYKDYQQYFMEGGDGQELTEAQNKAMAEMPKLRDMKYVYMATLQKKVRK